MRFLKNPHVRRHVARSSDKGKIGFRTSRYCVFRIENSCFFLEKVVFQNKKKIKKPQNNVKKAKMLTALKIGFRARLA